MIDNKEIEKINRRLRKQILQKFGAVAAFFLVVGSVTYFGVHAHQASHAATGGALTMEMDKLSVDAGSEIHVRLIEDSGTQAVNAVQASVQYDPKQLHYVRTTEGKTFQNAATRDTDVAGVVKIARTASQDMPDVIGSNTVVTLTFKAIGSSATAYLHYEPTASYLVRSSDNVNILTMLHGASVRLEQPPPSINMITSASGNSNGSELVTINGANFIAGATVSFDNISANQVTLVNDTTISVSLPKHSPGLVNVKVMNPDGQMATKLDGYQYK